MISAQNNAQHFPNFTSHRRNQAAKSFVPLFKLHCSGCSSRCTARPDTMAHRSATVVPAPPASSNFASRRNGTEDAAQTDNPMGTGDDTTRLIAARVALGGIKAIFPLTLTRTIIDRAVETV